MGRAIDSSRFALEGAVVKEEEAPAAASSQYSFYTPSSPSSCRIPYSCSNGGGGAGAGSVGGPGNISVRRVRSHLS